MNERIRELAKEAGLPVIDGEWDYNDREILCQVDGEWRVATPSEIISVLFDCEKGREKFAQLIVRECAEVCASIAAVRAGYNDADGRDTADSCGDQIKEHFGVE